MSEIEFNKILQQVCIEEYSFLEEVPVHHFSLIHRRKMKHILSQPYSMPETDKKIKLNRHMVCILIAAIFLALVTVTGAACVISHFIMIMYPDNTQLFAANTAGAPETIEQEYCIPELPEGYKEITRISTFESIWVIYQYGDDAYNNVTFSQNVKTSYDQHFNTEGYSFEKVDINGYDGLFIDWSDDDYICCEAVWDNGDYILTVEGNLTKSELIDLAKTVKLV